LTAFGSRSLDAIKKNTAESQGRNTADAGRDTLVVSRRKEGLRPALRYRRTLDRQMTLTLNTLPVTCGDQSPSSVSAGPTEPRAPEHDNLPNEVAKDLAELFKLLSDETRLRILFLLQQRHELNVRTLCQILRQSQPAVSHHLALLRVAGLIDMRRDGKHNFYRLLPRRFEELLGMIFATVPGEGQQIRLDDFVLTYTQNSVSKRIVQPPPRAL
jgi:ArsR family transcriptional regulator, arsenate/arsenite/antimonite-responsive transcriptional repressor